MFSKLRDSFRKGMEKLRKKEGETPSPSQESLSKRKPSREKPEASGLRRITTKQLSEKDIDEFFDSIELDLIQADVALEVADFLRKEMKEKLEGERVRRGKTDEALTESLRESLLMAFRKEDPIRKLEDAIKKARLEGRPACIVFLGFNGSGKTTTIARVAHLLSKKGHRPVLAAGDTFRAAAIEQLEVHGERIGARVIKHQYGADSAAVIFDAVKFARSKGFDVVLADTAGRAHTDRNLMDELRKVVRVNNPDLKILVVDSLTGNDAVEQARRFSEAVGIDGVVMTKTDVNEKGGSILSVAYATGKPILFIGTGQGYDDLWPFDPEEFVNQLLG